MTVITRLSRLFRADIHAVLDHMEEPDVLLRQAVREMEEELENSRRDLDRQERELARLEKQKLSLSEQLDKLERETGLCFESGNESLAKTFIRRKLETASLHKAVTGNIETAREQLDAGKKQFSEHQLSYESIKQKAELVWREQESRGRRHLEDVGSCVPMVREEDIELEFVRQKERFRTVKPETRKAE